MSKQQNDSPTLLAQVAVAVLFTLFSPIITLVQFTGSIIWWLTGEDRYWRDRNQQRKGESICTFARGFDFRKLDTWILRAVYEELAVQAPIRPCDHLERDLRLDGEDIGDCVEAIAVRCGRSLDNASRNPWWDRVETVSDLVMYLHHQPHYVKAGDVPDHFASRRVLYGSNRIVFEE